jgi:hypothetical protein
VSRSSYEGPKRGRHKGARSAETRAWNALRAQTPWLRNAHGVRVMPRDPEEKSPEGSRSNVKPKPATPPPRRPPWLDPTSYRALLELRKDLA